MLIKTTYILKCSHQGKRWNRKGCTGNIKRKLQKSLTQIENANDQSHKVKEQISLGFQLGIYLRYKKGTKRTHRGVFKLAKWIPTRDLQHRLPPRLYSSPPWHPPLPCKIPWLSLFLGTFSPIKLNKANSKYEFLMACPPQQSNYEDTLHVIRGAAAQCLTPTATASPYSQVISYLECPHSCPYTTWQLLSFRRDEIQLNPSFWLLTRITVFNHKSSDILFKYHALVIVAAI